MANHVDNFITVFGNKAATAEFESIFSSIFSDDKGLRDAEFLPRDEDGQVDMNSIGAKWAYVEDACDDCATVTSAWGAVLPFVELLGDHLTDFDPDVKLTIKFTDEGYNFVGAGVYEEAFLGWDEETYDELVSAFCKERSIDDPDEYDPWEDDGWYEWVDNRIDRILDDQMG
jgi:hypothetical protein